MDFENRGNIDYHKPVVSTGSSESKDFQKVTEDVKQNIAIMETLDELDIAEGNQSDYIKSINELNIPIQEIKDSAMDESDLNLIIEKYRITEEQSEITEEQSEITEEQSEITEEQSEIISIKNEKIKNVQNILKDFKGGKNESKYSSVLEKVKSEDSNVFESGLKEIKDNPVTSYYLLEDLKTAGKYEEFKSSLNSYDLGFDKIFVDYELGKLEHTANIKLGVSDFSGDYSKNILEYSKAGKTIEAGVDEDGNDFRNVLFEDSDYKLSSNLDDGSLNKTKEIDNKVDKDISLINESLSILDNFYKFIEKAISNNFDLSYVKENLKLISSDIYDKLGIDSKTSVDDIKSSISYFKIQKDKEKKDIIEKAKSEKNKILKFHEEKIKLQDLEKLNVLKFLNQTGFDLIPQEFTNQLIAEFKANTFDIPGLTLNPETIDLENSRFGESDSEKGGDKWKDNLVKFLEKLLYGEVGYKDSIFKGKEFKGELGSHINPLDFNKALIDSGIKSGTGFDINQMRENLEKNKKDFETDPFAEDYSDILGEQEIIDPFKNN